MRVIGLDPGYANFGISLAERRPGHLRFHFLDVVVITTEPDHDVKRKADDTARRVQAIARHLLDMITEHKPSVLCLEAIALPYGRIQTSVISALGRVRGVLDAYAEEHGLALLEVGSQAIKRAVTGRRDATKLEVQKGLEGMYPELAVKWPQLKGQHEHAADSAGVIHACRSAPEILAVLEHEGRV